MSAGSGKDRRIVAIPGGQQLLEDPAAIQTRLATPEFEFAILAGTGGINPLIDSPNDFTVTVGSCCIAFATRPKPSRSTSRWMAKWNGVIGPRCLCGGRCHFRQRFP